MRCIPLLLSMLALACGGPPSSTENRDEDPSARGATLYRTHGCIACHGPEGRGDGLLAGSLDPQPRDLRDPASYRQGHSAEEISRTIGMGVLGRKLSPMPSYPHLSRADKDALAAWVVTLQGGAIRAPSTQPPRVKDGWVRAVPPGAQVTAAYLTLQNDGPGERVLDSVAADGFETVEIHEVREQDGVAQMRPLSRLKVPAGGAVALRPGGVHLMLIGPATPVQEGESRKLTLRFEDGTALEVVLPVRRGPETGA